MGRVSVLSPEKVKSVMAELAAEGQPVTATAVAKRSGGAYPAVKKIVEELQTPVSQISDLQRLAPSLLVQLVSEVQRIHKTVEASFDEKLSHANAEVALVGEQILQSIDEQRRLEAVAINAELEKNQARAIASEREVEIQRLHRRLADESERTLSLASAEAKLLGRCGALEDRTSAMDVIMQRLQETLNGVNQKLAQEQVASAGLLQQLQADQEELASATVELQEKKADAARLWLALQTTSALASQKQSLRANASAAKKDRILKKAGKVAQSQNVRASLAHQKAKWQRWRKSGGNE